MENKETQKIEEVICNCDYDDLSAYGKGIRDFYNYIYNREEITQEDIIEEELRLQKLK